MRKALLALLFAIGVVAPSLSAGWLPLFISSGGLVNLLVSPNDITNAAWMVDAPTYISVTGPNAFTVLSPGNYNNQGIEQEADAASGHTIVGKVTLSGTVGGTITFIFRNTVSTSTTHVTLSATPTQYVINDTTTGTSPGLKLYSSGTNGDTATSIVCSNFIMALTN